MSWHAIEPRILYIIGSIFVILIIASITVRLLRWSKPQGDFRELGLRVRTWWVMVIIFSLAMLFGRRVSLAFFALMSFLALKEYLSLIPTRRADRRVLLWAYICIPLQYLWIDADWYGMFIIFIPVYMFLFLPVRMVMIGETSGFLKAIGTIHWGLMMAVYNFSHLAYILNLDPAKNPNGGSAALLLYLAFLTQFNDVSQYIWGKSFGRHAIIPKVSPKKTYEGFFGGIATTLILAIMLAPWLTPLSPVHALIIGLVIGLGGFAGDVVISAIKRDLQIKDSGTILPGHGGILDRLDSMLYTAPLFFHTIRYLYY